MFIQNLGAFAEALGVENAPSVVYLALVPWPSEQERDDFIRTLTRKEPGAIYG